MSTVRSETAIKLEPASQRTREDRSILLVVGSGRSGTSVFSGILQRLGFHVPQPEVPADDSNPRGFAESQWVVDFHTRLLKRARIQTADARPMAWAEAARVSLEERVRNELKAWLEKQFEPADHILIKDPRLSWFLPLWHQCAGEMGAAPRFATVLRHPAAVLRSKQQWYAEWVTDASRAAGWLNQVLFTERATREGDRAFVRYQDLLGDWARAIEHLAQQLDLPLIANASATSMTRVAQFLDPSLSRSAASWESLEVSPALREQAKGVWNLLNKLAEEGEDPALHARFDRVRASYTSFYGEAEAVAQSSVWAASRTRVATRRQSPIVRVVPQGLRRRVPLPVRKALLPLLSPRRGR